jgi:hypothetical protein
MKVKVPNYLYPLATDRKLQWTRETVKGEKAAKTYIKPKKRNAAKKQIVKTLVKDKKMALRFGKPLKTRSYVNPMLKMVLPEDPMKTPDPRPGNAMHIANTRAMYNGYQK